MSTQFTFEEEGTRGHGFKVVDAKSRIHRQENVIVHVVGASDREAALNMLEEWLVSLKKIAIQEAGLN